MGAYVGDKAFQFDMQLPLVNSFTTSATVPPQFSPHPVPPRKFQWVTWPSVSLLPKSAVSAGDEMGCCVSDGDRWWKAPCSCVMHNYKWRHPLAKTKFDIIYKTYTRPYI